ncbi:MAG: hypothetical protein IT211_03700 [Armatimonadetes bacterium]|nr:hypothetical protein [Armatimonadota bacterium]
MTTTNCIVAVFLSPINPSLFQQQEDTMIRPTNRSLPFDFGPLLGPLAPPTDPPSNPPPPDNPFGGPNDPIKAQDPKDRIPFDGPIKPKPIKGGLLLPNDPVQAQNPKDKIQIEYARCSPDDFVVIVNGPYQDDGWYQRKDTAPRPPFSSGIVFFVNWENRRRYFIPMLYSRALSLRNSGNMEIQG